MTHLNSATVAARQIVSTLIQNGVRDVVLCPGSRSAPLAFALADAHQSGWLNLRMVVDERSAAFVALGLSKGALTQGRLSPAAVITTSGTAVANLHPALLEASHSGVPLIAITADRPHHMRGVGANQTTHQAGIFGRTVRGHADIPAGEPVGNHLVRLIASATGQMGGVLGPVHFNIAFADPLPPPAPWEVPNFEPAARHSFTQQVRPPVITRPIELTTGTNGVIVAGDQAGWVAHEVAEQLQWPILAEPSSGVRHSPYAAANYHRTLAELGNDITEVLVYGTPTLSRDISGLLARTDITINVVSRGGEWPDVAGVAANVSGGVVINAVMDPAPTWLQQWQAPQDEPVEWGMEVAMWQLMTAPMPLFIGSSLPIRIADSYGPVGKNLKAPQIWANRGLAGIDGNIATATGLAIKAGAARAAIGDVTFVHDAMSLVHGVHEPDVNLQVVVLDNAGGKIFHTLEYGAPEFGSYLPRMFDTAQRINIAALATGAGARYAAATNAAQLADVLAEPVRGRSVVHVQLPQ